MHKRIIEILILLFMMVCFYIPFINKYIVYNFQEEDNLSIKNNIKYNHYGWITENVNVRANHEYSYTEYEMPQNTGFKSYMSYTAITSQESPQYQLQKYFAYTGNYGIRQVNDRYCVAIGTAFNANVGTYFDLILENGEVIQCIVGDIKSDQHTDESNIITLNNGCVSEFIVDPDSLDFYAKTMGDISYCKEQWFSNVIKIKIYDRNVFFE